MKRLPVFISLLILAVTGTTSADTEFVDTVPVEVAKQFITNPFGGQGMLYSDIMAAFPPFTVPADFEVLASADQGYVQRVILSTMLDEEAASAALLASFVDDGWVRIPVYGRPAQQTGFVSAEQPAVLPQQLCHDDHGMLTVIANAGTGPTYVHINHNVGAPGMPMIQLSCANMLSEASQNSPAMGFSRGNILNAYVPKLMMPVSNTTPAPMNSVLMGGGGGGSQIDWETRGNLAIDWSVDEIYAHFASQIAEQGWLDDSGVIGAMAANGSWTKNIDDMDLVGTLAIIKLADNAWDLRFRLIRQNAARSGGAIMNRVDTVR